MCWTVLPSLAERQLTEPRCILYSHNADYWYNRITGDVVGLANTPTVVAKDGSTAVLPIIVRSRCDYFRCGHRNLSARCAAHTLSIS